MLCILLSIALVETLNTASIGEELNTTSIDNYSEMSSLIDETFENFTDYNETFTEYNETDYNETFTEYNETDYNETFTEYYNETDYNETFTEYNETDYNETFTEYNETDYNETDNDNNEKLDGGEIAGIIIGCIIFLIAVFIISLCIYKRNSLNKLSSSARSYSYVSSAHTL